jgi:Carboxypeptidase regulatory-like domain/TonB dependent receptor
MRKRFFPGLFTGVIAILLGLSASISNAQTNDGSLRGEITDNQGASVADAKVTATNLASQVTYNTTTTSSGVYVFSNLPVGIYSIAVEKDGFQKYVRTSVQVFSNQATEASIQLVVGSTSTTIEVTAGADLVQTSTSQISNDFNSKQVTELPNTSLDGSPLSLALLAPGTTGQGAGVLGEGGSIGGARPRMNSFSIDGVDDNRLDVTGHSQPVIADSIAEFNLITNQFAAEYGHSAGGQFNIITKAGGNAWHGTAFGYNQNRHYNSRDNLDKVAGLSEPSRFDYNRVGGDIGGPIIHNKLFIYGSYQRIWEGLATAAVAQSAPTADGLATLKSLAADSAVVDVLNQFPVASSASSTEVVSAPGCPVGGCLIPFGTISPRAPNFQNQHDFIINTDYNHGKHAISFHVLYDRNRQPNVNADTPLSQFTGSTATDVRKYLFKDTWTINDRFVNDFRTSLSRFVLDFGVPTTFSNFPNVELDADGLNVGPQGCSPQGNIINTYQVLDNVSYVRGKHTFKAGVEWRHWIAPGNFLPRSRGEWDYADINQLVNDFVPNGSNGALRGAGSGFFAGNQNGIYFFVQDDWRVTTRLTLNLGLRYEWNGVPRDDGLQALNSISTLPGVYGFVFKKPDSDINNVGPRVGFAYDPFGDAKWAVRGGFGISYDVTPQNFPSISLPPQLQTEQNPILTCNLSGAPAWCANFDQKAYASGDNTGQGFLAGGGLLQVNVPCTTQLDCRSSTGSTIVNIVEPKILTWSLGVQHQIGTNSSIEVRYLGTRGLELPIQARLNTQTGFTAGLGALPTFLNQSDIPTTVTGGTRLSDWDTFENNANDCPTTGPSPFIHGADGLCGGALVTGFPPRATSTYHGASVDFNHRVGHGLTLRANYTFSKNIDTATNELFSTRVDPRRAQDWANVNQDRGLSSLDVPHKFALSWVYELPKLHSGHSFLNGLANGWQYSGTFLAFRGQPITIINGSDANGNFDNAGDRPVFNPAGVGNTASDIGLVCAGPGGATSTTATDPACSFSNINLDDSTVVGYYALDPNAKYVVAGLGAVSTLGRNTFRSPGVNVWDMGIAKYIHFTERYSLQLGVQALNIFNHRNFSLAQPSVFEPLVNNALSTSYNNINAFFASGNTQFLNSHQFSGGARNMQLLVKFIF